MKKHEDESGIIYCATKKNVDKLYTLLNEQGISAGRYHAGLSNDERKQNQEDFTYDRIRVMVATNAFGMGIDKSNVRYVLHYNMPQASSITIRRPEERDETVRKRNVCCFSQSRIS